MRTKRRKQLPVDRNAKNKCNIHVFYFITILIILITYVKELFHLNQTTSRISKINMKIYIIIVIKFKDTEIQQMLMQYDEYGYMNMVNLLYAIKGNQDNFPPDKLGNQSWQTLLESEVS